MKIEELLDSNEKILWKGKPKYKSYLLSSIWVFDRKQVERDKDVQYNSVVQIFLWICAALVSIYIIIIGTTIIFSFFMPEAIKYGFELPMVLLKGFVQHPTYRIPFFGFIALFALLFVYSVLYLKNIEYAFTDRRVVIKEGAVGTDFNYIDYDKIKETILNVGLIDKIFHTGSIVIIPEEDTIQELSLYNKLNICNINNPRETFKLLKRISYDIKSDMYYPNKYRSAGTGKGYFTSYGDKNERNR